MSKEFIWELEVDNDFKIFKCVVSDTEVVTYEGDEEKKHLKITNPKKKIGVLQIDTQTRIFGDMIPIRMENDTPYLMLEGKWIMSDTTRDQRLEKAVNTHRRNSIIELCIGLVILCACAVMYVVKRSLDSLSILIAIGFMLVYAGVSTMVRLKQELSDLVELEKERQEEKRAKRAAWAEARQTDVPGIESSADEM